MKVSELNKIIEETISNEIKGRILNENDGKKTVHCVKCEGEYIEVCESKDEADQKCEEYNKNNPNKTYVVEVETFESNESLINKLDELGEEKDIEDMKENQSMEEKLHGDQHKLDVDNDGKIDASDLKKIRQDDTNEDYAITEIDCEACGKGLCECGAMEESEDKDSLPSMNEMSKCVKEGMTYEDICEKYSNCDKKKLKEMYESCGKQYEGKESKILRLTESQMIDMVTKMVNEAKSNVPGVREVENAHKANKKETEEHMGNVDKKIKDTLTIEGGDNPEFPNANGKGEKKAIHNTEEDNEELNNSRGENSLDLDYDHEPSEEFKERLKKSLEGDSTMGNAEGGNTIKTDTGEEINKVAEKRKEVKEKAPMYVKDVQPVKELKEETSEVKNVLEEEISKMKKMFSYNEKTQ
mgnify:CR=1 FL=1